MAYLVVHLFLIEQNGKIVFPDFNTVEKMCEEYPGLAKAFENFKTVYKMVEQDWKGKMKDDQTSSFLNC